MKKQDLKAFLNKTERILLDAQFKRTVESDKAYGYEWIKDTKYGIFMLNPDNDNTSKIYSIFGRFTDPPKADYILAIQGGNPYSGKCNIHGMDKDYVICKLENLIKAVS